MGKRWLSAAIAGAAIRGGANALCAINTLRGMAIDVERQKPALADRIGGLGGVTTAAETIELAPAGAECGGIGTAMFHEPNVFETTGKRMQAYTKRKSLKTVR